MANTSLLRGHFRRIQIAGQCSTNVHALSSTNPPFRCVIITLRMSTFTKSRDLRGTYLGVSECLPADGDIFSVSLPAFHNTMISIAVRRRRICVPFRPIACLHNRLAKPLEPTAAISRPFATARFWPTPPTFAIVSSRTTSSVSLGNRWTRSIYKNLCIRVAAHG